MGPTPSELDSELTDVPPSAPSLVVLPDPETEAAARREVLGAHSLERLAAAARRAGFGRVLLTSGTQGKVVDALDVAASDPVGGPALVAYESATIHPDLLGLMVAHPLDDDEIFSLYDGVGRPAAAFVGELGHVPAQLPVCEELPYPETMGPDDVVRQVYGEDLARAEALVIAGDDVFPPAPSLWRRWVGVPSLRWLAARRGPMAQLELLCLALVAASLPLSLLPGALWMILGAVALLAGVHLSKLLKSVRVLRRGLLRDVGDPAGERLARATRPLGHAAMAAGLTYGMLATSDRADIAGLVLLAAGAGATLISLIQARLLLRGHDQPVFALPDAHAVFARVGMPMIPLIEGAPLFEVAVVLAACSTLAVLPWSVLVMGATARLWRWYAGPIGAAGD